MSNENVDHELRREILGESADFTTFGGPTLRLRRDATEVSEADLKAAGFSGVDEDSDD